jgi:hypothetical protein
MTECLRDQIAAGVAVFTPWHLDGLHWHLATRAVGRDTEHLNLL